MPANLNSTGDSTIMIVERYDPINLFELVPKLKLDFEPELAQSWINCSMTMNSSNSSRRIWLNATPTQEGSGATPHQPK